MTNLAHEERFETDFAEYEIINEATSEESNKNSDMPGFPGGGMGKNFGGSSYDFTLNGYSSLDAMSEFIGIGWLVR